MMWGRIPATGLAACGVVLSALGGGAARGEVPQTAETIGREIAVPRHLQNGEEYSLPLRALLEHGRRLFEAVWTNQEGGGRPLTKGTGGGLSDPSDPLAFPRNFNRVSAPDSNACSGCHNAPGGRSGGGGDFVTNVFVLGHRFDFATFGPPDGFATKGSLDERFEEVTLDDIANSRATLGMFGSGYIEMLARQMTSDLQAQRDTLAPGESTTLETKGVSFGVLARDGSGNWDTSAVAGLPAVSLISTGPANPPDLVVRPFHQAGRVVSLREFSNNAFNHHHGIQADERFGAGADPDGDGFTHELTRADMTAVTLFQATLAVPGRLIPRDPDVEAAVLEGEHLFTEIGCAECHRPSLPLDHGGWMFAEPDPYNPPGNLRPGDAPTLTVNLNGDDLPAPRLKPGPGAVVEVPAYTDLKLHDLTDGPDDANREPLDMQQPAGTDAFFAGNALFLTKKLWGAANEPPFFHHGKFATMREAVWAHGGEAAAVRAAFAGLGDYEQDCVIEFLKTLQLLPPGTRHLVVDEHGRPRSWPPR